LNSVRCLIECLLSDRLVLRARLMGSTAVEIVVGIFLGLMLLFVDNIDQMDLEWQMNQTCSEHSRFAAARCSEEHVEVRVEVRV
jgi:hypothetical protein